MTEEERIIVANMRSMGLGSRKISNFTGLSENTLKSFIRKFDKEPDYAASFQKIDLTEILPGIEKLVPSANKQQNPSLANENILHAEKQSISKRDIWQGLQKHQIVKKSCSWHSLMPIGESLRMCLQCGCPVIQIPGRKEKRFCSERCRKKYWSLHPELSKSKSISKKTCPTCGREFFFHGSVGRKYCSRKCYLDDRYGKDRIPEAIGAQFFLGDMP